MIFLITQHSNIIWTVSNWDFLTLLTFIQTQNRIKRFIVDIMYKWISLSINLLMISYTFLTKYKSLSKRFVCLKSFFHVTKRTKSLFMQCRLLDSTKSQNIHATSECFSHLMLSDYQTIIVFESLVQFSSFSKFDEKNSQISLKFDANRANI